MADPVWISWMPAWVHTADQTGFEVASGPDRGATSKGIWRCTRPRPEGWPAIETGLRKAAAVLREMSVHEIIGAIDRVSERWCDRSWPTRRAARDQVVDSTGFSAEAVERSFDVELRNYRASFLMRTLRRELGDPCVLDEFRSDAELPGRTRAFGPGITLAIFTGNVPGLPALSIVRALLVKSAVIAKVASGEPSFAAAFVRSLFEEDPRLADAIVVTYWDRDDRATLDAVLAHSDAVIAYGSDEACRAIREALPDSRIFIEHGHKFSAGVVSRAYLARHGQADVSRRIALDVATFNQHACIAPQIYLVEGSMAHARVTASHIAAALDEYSESCPLGVLGMADAASLQLRRAARAWASATGDGSDLFHARGLDWTVAVQNSLSELQGAGNRFIRVIPVPRLESSLDVLRPVGGYLQNVAIGAEGADFHSLARQVAELGASRICEPGRMNEPSMMWRHDGRTCVSGLLRWCDIEMHEEVILVPPGQSAFSQEPGSKR